jgi:alanyl-tRNA synthetase
LDRGERLFDQYVAKARQSGVKELNGKDVWRLYDTYGFPVDLTRLMAEELGFTVNEAEFEKAQLESKEASKGGAKKDGKAIVKLDVHDLGALEKDDSVPKTDDSAKYGQETFCFVIIWYSIFLGHGNITAHVKAIYYNKAFVKSTANIDSSDTLGVLLDRTSFYAESGGQEYDTGSIIIDGEAEFEVIDVQTFSGYVLHIGHMKEGALRVGDEVISQYDEVRSTCSCAA